MTVKDKIIELLDTQKIEYKLTEHEPVRTSEEAAQIRGTELKTGAKAMVGKANDQYYLFILPADKKLDWKKIKQLLNVKSISLASIEEAERITQVEMGSVPPFGNILGLKTFYDKTLLENEYVNFNIGSKRHSVQMKCSDLVELVKPEIVNIVSN